MGQDRDKELKWLEARYREHKGKWLEAKDLVEIRKRAASLPDTNGQLIGERRKLCFELMEEYGLTELEATNLINGRNGKDYVNVYYRIKNRIPLKEVGEEGKENRQGGTGGKRKLAGDSVSGWKEELE